MHKVWSCPREAHLSCHVAEGGQRLCKGRIQMEAPEPQRRLGRSWEQLSLTARRGMKAEAAGTHLRGHLPCYRICSQNSGRRGGGGRRVFSGTGLVREKELRPGRKSPRIHRSHCCAVCDPQPLPASFPLHPQRLPAGFGEWEAKNSADG